MSVSKQTLLDNVETAINNKLTGGAVMSYSIGGRSLMYYSLKDLMALRNQLRTEIAESTSGGTTNFASFENPS